MYFYYKGVGGGDPMEDDVGLENESLIVWFRVSAFPWFRKLYAHPREERDLPAGNYSIFITYSILHVLYNTYMYIIHACMYLQCVYMYMYIHVLIHVHV